jgi:PAS domain S-box-containing protein
MITEKYFQYIFKVSPLPSLLLLPDAPNFTIAEVNNAYLNFVGNNEQELIGKNIFEVFPKNHEEKNTRGNINLRQALLAVISTGTTQKMTSWKYDLPIRDAKTKETKYVDIENIPVLDENKKVICIIQTMQVVNAPILLQQKQRELEKKYNYLFENNPSPMFIWDFETLQIIDCNEEALMKYGYLREEFLQLTLRDIRPEEDIPLINEATKDEASYNKIHKKIWRHKKKNGEIIFMELSGHLIDYNGRRSSFVQLNDVTEKLKAERELKESEELYKLLFYKSPMPKWIYELDTLKILEVNETALAHYGYSREEFLSMTVNDIKPKEDLPKMQGIRESIKTQEGLIHFGIFTQLKKDKSRIKAEVSGNKFSFLGRNCMMVVCNDVTEKEKALQQLKDKEAKLLTAQKLAKLGYWQLQLEGNNLYWSDEVYNIWGVNKESFEVNLNLFLETIHPEDKESFEKEQLASVSGEKEHDFEHRILLPDGCVKWVHEMGKLFKDENGKPILFEGTVQDITDSQIAREKLLLSEARHRGIVESQTNYVIRTDLEGKYSYVNNKFIQDFSWIYPDQDIIGKDSMVSIKDYHQLKVIETVKKCFAQLNKVFQVEIDKPKQDGGIITTLWDFICLTDSAGQPSEIQCVGIDISDRIKSEKALKESNTRYEFVSKATSDIIWDWNIETNTIRWGEGFKTIFNYNSNQLIGSTNTWTEHLHPDDRERVMKGITSAIEGNETNWTDEYRYQKADGTYAFVLDKGFIIRNDKGKAIQIVGAMQDITETKKLKDLLDKSNKLSKIGSWEIDVVKGSVYWSDITKEIREADLDFDPDLSTGMNYFKEGNSRETIFKIVQECIENGTPWDEELQIITQKGNLKWIRTIGEAEIVNGKCIKVYGSFQDIDERKKAEKDILLSNERYTIVSRATNDSIWDWDLLKNEVVRPDKTLENLLGHQEISPQEVDDFWKIHVHPEDWKRITEQRNILFRNPMENYWEGEYRFLKNDGQYAYIYDRGYIIRDDNGKAIRMIGASRDITKLKENEVQLKALNEQLQKRAKELAISNAELEQFAYIASHDLQEPLRMVTSFLTQIEKKYGNIIDDKGKQYIHFAVDGAKRMRQIILDLLEFSRIGRAEDRKEEVDLNELINDIISLHRKQIQEKKAVIKLGKLPTLKTSKTPMRQVFQNLINNSLKYNISTAGTVPEIAISAKSTKSHWLFSVKDNGIGIDPQYFEKIFIIFQRLHNKDEFSGTGIGLAITKKIIESLGGKIWVESEEGKGSTFYFTIEKDIKTVI